MKEGENKADTDIESTDDEVEVVDAPKPRPRPTKRLKKTCMQSCFDVAQ